MVQDQVPHIYAYGVESAHESAKVRGLPAEPPADDSPMGRPLVYCSPTNRHTRPAPAPISLYDWERSMEVKQIDAECVDAERANTNPNLPGDTYQANIPKVRDLVQELETRLLNEQGGRASSSNSGSSNTRRRDKNNAADHALVNSNNAATSAAASVATSAATRADTSTRSPYTVQHRREKFEQTRDTPVDVSSSLSGLQEALDQDDGAINLTDIYELYEFPPHMRTEVHANLLPTTPPPVSWAPPPPRPKGQGAVAPPAPPPPRAAP